MNRQAPRETTPGTINMRQARSLYRKTMAGTEPGTRQAFKPWARTSKLLRERGTPVGKLAGIVG